MRSRSIREAVQIVRGDSALRGASERTRIHA
jgi:hypothetical protein